MVLGDIETESNNTLKLTASPWTRYHTVKGFRDSNTSLCANLCSLYLR